MHAAQLYFCTGQHGGHNTVFGIAEGIITLSQECTVGLLLMAMSSRYAQACDRVRENLRQQGRSPDFDPGIEERLILNYHRAELLRKAILFVVLSAASSGLLVLASTLEGMFGVDLLIAKHVLLLCCVGLIVISTVFFALEVTTSLKALALRKEQESAIRRRRFTN